MSLLIVYLTEYRTLTSSVWSPGGARVILTIFTILAGEVPDEVSFIFCRSRSIKKYALKILKIRKIHYGLSDAQEIYNLVKQA